MRKIYFFLPEFPKFSTGGHKYHNYLYEYFNKKSDGIGIIGTKPDYDKIKDSKLLKLITGFYYIFKVDRNSIIVVTNTEYLFFLLPIIFSKLIKRHKYYMIIHHLQSDQRKSFILDFIERVYIKTADKIVTVSNTTLQILLERRIINKNVEIIEPGLDFQPEKEKLVKTDFIFRLLFVGTIEKRKGLIYLIEALRILNSNNFKLTIVGNIKNNDYYNSITNLIKEYNFIDKVKFLQNIANEELKIIYINSDCLVFPTLWEGYGMVVTEAMACGLPVIASDIPSIRELMTDETHGFLIESSRPDLIADKLNVLINNPGLRRIMAINCLETAKKFRTWEEISKVHYEILEKMKME